MKNTSLKSTPFGVLLIAAFYIFGAFMLLVSIIINPVGVSQIIALAHGFSPTMGVEILIAVAVLALVLGYGLVRMRQWGFFLMLAYSLYLAVISLVMGGLSFAWTGEFEAQRTFGFLLWSTLVVVYLILVRRRFVE